MQSHPQALSWSEYSLATRIYFLDLGRKKGVEEARSKPYELGLRRVKAGYLADKQVEIRHVEWGGKRRCGIAARPVCRNHIALPVETADVELKIEIFFHGTPGTHVAVARPYGRKA
jgi:hypothetical protein